MQTVRFLRSSPGTKVSLRALAAFSVAAYVLTAQPAYTVDSWNVGDVFVGVGDPYKVAPGGVTEQDETLGVILRYGLGAAPVQELAEPAQGFTSGCAYYPDPFATTPATARPELWTTSFSSIVNLYDPTATPGTWWGTGNRSWLDVSGESDGVVESLAFAPDGSIFVATPYATDAQLHHYTHGDTAQNKRPAHIKSYPDLVGGGADWIDIDKEADGDVVVYYTAEAVLERDKGADYNDRLAAGESAGVYKINITAADDPLRNDPNSPGFVPYNVQIATLPVDPLLPKDPKAWALRVLPKYTDANNVQHDQGLLVAGNNAVYWLTLDGQLRRTFTAMGGQDYFALNITPDGGSFWTATAPITDGYGHTLKNAFAYKVNISTGVVERTIDMGQAFAADPTRPPVASVGGLCIVREYTAAFNECTIPDPQDPTRAQVVACPSLRVDSCEDEADNDGNGLKNDGCSVELTEEVAGGGINFSTVPSSDCGAYDIAGLPSFMQCQESAGQPGQLQLWSPFGPGPYDAQPSPYEVQITFTPTGGQPVTGSYYILVKNANHKPEFTQVGSASITQAQTEVALSIPEGNSPAIDLRAADIDSSDIAFPDHLTYTIDDAGGLPVTLDPVTGVFSATRRLEEGTYTLRVTVSDDHNAQDHLTITVTVTDVNQAPTIAIAAIPTRSIGIPLTFTPVAIDPDGDTLAFSRGANWPAGFTLDPATGTVTGTSLAGGTFVFEIVVSDGRGGTATATASATFVTNQPPVCSGATPSVAILWPPNHKLRPITINGVVDPDGQPLAIVVTGIFQDEPTNTEGDGNTAIDGKGVGTSTAWVRAERTGNVSIPGDGRVYHIVFTATDAAGETCTGEVQVGVPHDKGGRDTPIDGGALYDSMVPTPGGAHYAGDGCDHDKGKKGHKAGDGDEHDRAARSRR